MSDPTAEPPPVQAPSRAEARAEAPRCPECEAPVAGAYCAACGQKAGALRQPAHRFVRDSVSEFFGLDGRVWRTFGTLLFRPGALTRAHHEGRRQRFLSPLRVYLTSTLLFFFLLSLLDPVEALRDEITRNDSAEDTVTVAAHLAANDSIVAGGLGGILSANASAFRYTADAALDSSGASFADSVRADARDSVQAQVEALADSLAAGEAQSERDLARAAITLRRARAESAVLRTMPPDSLVSLTQVHDAMAVLYPDTVGFFGGDGLITGGNEATWLTRSAAVQRLRTSQTTEAQADGVVTFVRSAIGHVPTVFFVLLPLFALVLKLLYVRREWFYAEHVVFGLHTHAFAFVVFAAVTLLLWGARSVSGVGWIVGALFLTIPVYFVVAQKRVYGQSWRKTVAKSVLLGSVYGTAFFFGLIGAIVLAAMLG